MRPLVLIFQPPAARVFWAAVFALSVGLGPTARSESGAAGDRAARVEHGLLPPPGRSSAPATLAERMYRYDVAGVGVAVVHRGRIDWARGYGVLEAGKPARVDDATLFHGCSISKVVNAVAVMKLVEQGKLSLDEDVNRRLVSWKVPPGAGMQGPRGEKVTLRRILSHSAGFGSPFATPYAPDGPVPTLVQILDGLPPSGSTPVRVLTPPGSEYAYSGGGVTVSQLLIEDVTGEPYAKAVERLVFRPLGMSDCTFEQWLPADQARRAAPGHNDEGAVVNGVGKVYPALAAGGIWATPGDLAKLVIELQGSGAGRKVLAAASVAEMCKPQIKVDEFAEAGLGLFLAGEGRSRRFYHSGVHAGYWVFFMGYVESGEGIVLMTNNDTGGFLCGEILRAAAKEYAWPGYEEPLPITSTHP